MPMPVELSATAVERGLARLGEHELDARPDVEAGLESIAGWEDDGEPIVVTRYRLQLFLWYELPRNLLAPLAVKQAVAERLGRFLELVGGAGAYAEICASEQTMRMLRAWEVEEQSAGELLREALEASGLEPPDTDELRWRSMMGFEEARLRDRIALELECAVEEGRLDPVAGDFKGRQAELVTAFLHNPDAGLDGRPLLDQVAEERLEQWAGHGSQEHRAILAAVVSRLGEPVGELAGEEILAPLSWLLEEAAAGIPLTQTGALNRALVRTGAERFPGWWRAETFGPPHREDEVAALCEVHDLARRMRLLRRRGHRLLLTKRGEAVREGPASLLKAVAPHLLAADGFAAAAQELTAALILSGETLDCDEIETGVHAAIVADGWTADGQPPTAQEVARAAFGVIRLAEALDLVVYDHEYDRESRRSRRELTLMPAGRAALRMALRSRAVG